MLSGWRNANEWSTAESLLDMDDLPQRTQSAQRNGFTRIRADWPIGVSTLAVGCSLSVSSFSP
jgi:hypothetical protein